MSKKVVFVDDSRSILKAVEIILRPKVESGELIVETFSKPVEFLEAVKNEDYHFDMMFLDINMPVLSGYDVIFRLRQLKTYESVPVVALTTESSQEAKEKGKAVFFTDWIIKINAPTTLLQSLESMFEKYMPKEQQVAHHEEITPEESMSEIDKLFATIEDLNKKLVIAEDNKSRFLSLVYNEFNNPLLSVTMLMRDVIENQKLTKEEVVENVEMAFGDILTLNNQLSNIMAAAEIESTSGLEKCLAHFDVHDVIADILQSQELIYKEKEIPVEINLNFPGDIYHDRDKLFLILRNLIENAFEFSLARCPIKIEGHLDGKNIIFMIQNRGSHIKENQRVFDAFYQEKSDFSRIHHGLGLGLAIVRNLVNFLGGLVMYSTSDDEYNIFRISLPIEVCVDCKNPETDSFAFDDNLPLSGARF